MASFDQVLAGLFGSVPQGAWGGISDTFFGVPASIFGLTAEQIKDIPSPILKEILNILITAFNKADESVKEVRKKALLESGLLEYDTDIGTYVLLSDTAKYGLDANEGQAITDIEGFINSIDNS